MNGNEPNNPASPAEEQDESVKRNPEDANEDQLDEALEETFPASDPISP